MNDRLVTSASSATTIAAIVPAAGVGSRMQSEKPKQYLRIAGQTILQHSLQALLADARIKHIFLALAADDAYFERLELPEHWPITTVVGGDCRAASVAAGIAAAAAAGYQYVAVHDAARPCLAVAELSAVLDAGIAHPHGAILAVPVVDTLKRSQTSSASSSRPAEIAQTVARNGLWQAQTPQVFRTDVLQQALQRLGVDHPSLTDEASALEQNGMTPQLVAGSPRNLKVTSPADLALAELFLMHAGTTLASQHSKGNG